MFSSTSLSRCARSSSLQVLFEALSPKQDAAPCQQHSHPTHATSNRQPSIVNPSSLGSLEQSADHPRHAFPAFGFAGELLLAGSRQCVVARAPVVVRSSPLGADPT